MTRFTFKMTAILGALLTICLALGTPATAQDSPIDLLEHLEGLESAYARSYIAASELDLGLLASPEPTGESTSTTFVEATVLEFTEASDVSAAFEMVLNEEIARMIMGEPEMELDVSESVELGDRAQLYMGSTGDDGTRVVDGLLVVQDGNLGFIVSAEGSDDSIERTLMDFGSFMVDAQPGTGDVVVDEGAGASGGTLDVLPSVDDPGVLSGLVPMHDYNLLVSNSPIEIPATPAT